MKRLQIIRKYMKLSQRDLSEISGVSYRLIQHYEQGFREIDGAGIEILFALADSLQCRISDLIENEELREKLKGSDY